MFLITGLVCGTILAVVLAGIGFGELSLAGFIVGAIWGIFIGSSSGMSTRIGRDTWIHHRW
jgi:hypothetical protein